MNTKDRKTVKIYTLSEKSFFNHLETKGITELWGAGSIFIDGVEYDLTEDQQNEVERIVNDLEQEQITIQMRFEQECNKYNEVGF